jgi:hypothetical protein
MRVSWETWSGMKHEGEIIMDDGDCYMVCFDNGVTKVVDKKVMFNTNLKGGMKCTQEKT